MQQGQPATQTVPKQCQHHARLHTMICRSCLRAASRSARQIAAPPASLRPQPTTRFFATSSSAHSPPAATSTSAAQPFSEPLTPAASPDAKATAADAAKKKAVPLVKSSVPAGQPLKGLNFLKDRQDPIAAPDEEYPAWLWTLLDRQEKKADKAAGDLFCKSRYPHSFYA